MRIRLSLTTLIDLDLLTLSCIPDFDFKVWVRDSLRAYANTGKAQRVPLPTEIPENMTIQSITLSITFDKRKDAAVEKWLQVLKTKQRSGAIKAVLRGSLEEPCLFAHYESFPTFFQTTSFTKGHIAAKAAGNTEPAYRTEVISGTLPSQTAPAQPPEEEGGDFDFFNLSMDPGE